MPGVTGGNARIVRAHLLATPFGFQCPPHQRPPPPPPHESPVFEKVRNESPPIVVEDHVHIISALKPKICDASNIARFAKHGARQRRHGRDHFARIQRSQALRVDPARLCASHRDRWSTCDPGVPFGHTRLHRPLFASLRGVTLRLRLRSSKDFFATQNTFG